MSPATGPSIISSSQHIFRSTFTSHQVEACLEPRRRLDDKELGGLWVDPKHCSWACMPGCWHWSTTGSVFISWHATDTLVTAAVVSLVWIPLSWMEGSSCDSFSVSQLPDLNPTGNNISMSMCLCIWHCEKENTGKYKKVKIIYENKLQRSNASTTSHLTPEVCVQALQHTVASSHPVYSHFLVSS